jgi:hypothetical protein
MIRVLTAGSLGGCIKFLLASILFFLMHAAWAEESPPAPDDDSANATEAGEMKETGGFVNMKAQTDYDAPEPERTPAGDSDSGDNGSADGGGEGD